ncbi:MAG: TonB-dependent receptor [Acidobacteriia bacterium]|nr:TonB-dependent receptor [Terriglobia bacterium]
MRNGWLRLSVSFLLLSLAICWPHATLQAQSQVFSASLRGTIYDHTGATVPGATITLSNPDKGFSNAFTSSNDGSYVFTLVPPGTYTLKVEHAGFRPYTQVGIVLAVGQSANQDVTLELGQVTQEVTVRAQAAILNTGNANVGSDVTQRQAVDLPLNWRNVYGLVLLNSSVNNNVQNQALNPPGTQGNVDQDIAFFNFGGSVFGTTAFLLDGHWDGSGDWDGVIYVPGVDELGEFKIQTNAFTAQYGWSMGNVLNAITKSGTRSFHGDVFEFLRNDNLDANNFFNNRNGLTKPDFKRNQFGFSAGGPLYFPKIYRQRDKTFIFGYYEGLRQKTPATLIATTPTSDFRTGNFSALLGPQIGIDALGRPILSGQLYDPVSTRKITAGQEDAVTGLMATQTGFIRDPFPGNMISSAIDPVAKNIASGSYWPKPTNSALVNNFAATGGLPTALDKYSIRVDHNISDKARMFVRWSQQRQYKQLVGPYFGESDPAGPRTKNPNNRWDYGFNYNRSFSPTFLMSLTWGWNRWVEGRAVQNFPFKPSTLGLPAFLDAVAPAFPPIGFDDGTVGLAGAGFTGGTGTNNSQPREVRTYAVDFTKIKGPHTMTMGFMMIDHQLRAQYTDPVRINFTKSMTQGPDPTAALPATGLGFASFLLGAGHDGNLNNAARTAYQKGLYGWYFQDDWKASRKLTLNLGLRYDFQTAPTDRFNRLSYFDYNAANPVGDAAGYPVKGELVYVGNGHRRGVYEPQFTNFAPRLGLTYSATHRMVMRAGFGMFYTPTMEFGDYQGLQMYGFSQSTPYVGTIDGITPNNLLSDPFPNGLLVPVGNAKGTLTQVGLSTNAIPSQKPTPYVEQWTLGLQYELTPNMNFDVTYVGNHGVKLSYSSVQRNVLPTADLAIGSALLDPVPNPFYGHITASSCGLDQPTVPRGQLLRPYPEFCDVTDPQSLGASSYYNGVTLSVTHRWSNGLHFLASYTISKYLSGGEGNESWAAGNSATMRDYHNLAAEKSLNPNDIPQALVLNYLYELPIGRGKRWGGSMSGPVDAVIGGWQVSGVTTFKKGFPLSIVAASNNTNSLGGGQRPNIVADPKLSNPTVDEWFNTAAFAQPPAFTFGDTPREMPNLRAPGINNWDLALQKWWTAPKERLRVQFRAETYNTFNHANFYAPNQTFGDPSFGRITGALPARSIQIGLKIYW